MGLILSDSQACDQVSMRQHLLSVEHGAWDTSQVLRPSQVYIFQ